VEEKADLEEESRRLDEEQRQQNLCIKILCEKLVEEIKKKNSQKRQTIDQMQTRIDKLARAPTAPTKFLLKRILLN